MEDKLLGCKYRLNRSIQNITKNDHPIPYNDVFEKSNPLGLDPKNIFGFEVEVENLPDTPEVAAWTCTSDGSLRNYGREYVSKPIGGDFVTPLFEELFERLNSYQADYNPRAGIHVHVNCMDLKVGQVQKAILYYYLLEPAFFRISQPHRRESVFCVPLSETNTILDYLEFEPRPGWKYSALNMLPIFTLGTLEFRHLQSTDNTNLIYRFVQLIDSIITACRDTDIVLDKVLSDIKEDPVALVQHVLGDRFSMFCQENIIFFEDIYAQANHFIDLFSQSKCWDVVYGNAQAHLVSLVKEDYSEEVIEEEEFV